MLDIQKIRNDFPILKQKVYGKPLVYFDNAATSQTPECVVDTIRDGYDRINANVHRGVHFLSQEATEGHENARKECSNICMQHTTTKLFLLVELPNL